MLLPCPHPLKIASYHQLHFDDLLNQLIVLIQDDSLLVSLSQVVSYYQASPHI
jgi:hypothetical protein